MEVPGDDDPTASAQLPMGEVEVPKDTDGTTVDSSLTNGCEAVSAAEAQGQGALVNGDHG